MTLSAQHIVVGCAVALLCITGGIALVRRDWRSSASDSTVFVLLRGPSGEEARIAVERADDPEERRNGLMFRTHLPAGMGMLFLFEEERPLSFWMKNTRIPLDILFFDATGAFVSRAGMDPCAEEQCPSTGSARPARFALEVNRGERMTLPVGAGWTLHVE